LKSNYVKMDGNKLMQQMTAVFSVFMVVFYLGVGIYLLFYMKFSTVQRPVLVIMGSTFIFYGLYRGYRSFVKIREVFFSNDDN
jgi:hypothetical protein